MILIGLSVLCACEWLIARERFKYGQVILRNIFLNTSLAQRFKLEVGKTGDTVCVGC